MPNYRLSEGARNWIVQDASGLLDRYQMLHAIGCPLTVTEVFTILWDYEHRDAWRLMYEAGVSMHHYQWIGINVTHPTVPGLVVAIAFTASTDFPSFGDRPLADVNRLPEDRREKFYQWLEPAVLAARKVHTAKRIVREFVLREHLSGTTVAHMLARWPDMADVLLSMQAPWPERVRGTPPDTGRYYWSTANADARAWFADNINRMEATGALLTSARMMGGAPVDSAQVHGRIDRWELKK